MSNIIPILFIILLILFLLLFFGCLLSLIFTIKLRYYLKKNNYLRWHEITTIANVSGGANPVRLFRYVYSDIDNEDQFIFNNKNKLRKFFNFSIFLFILILLLIFVYFILNVI